MTVTLETLVIGNRDGPRVWIATRRRGTHLDIAQAPDSCARERDAVAWAAKKYGVPECEVKFSQLQIVEIATAEQEEWHKRQEEEVR